MGRPQKGSVWFHKQRKYWVASLEWTDELGHRKQRKRKVENKSAGDILIKKWQRELDQEGAAYLDAEKITFKQLADEYKEQRLIEPVYRNEKKVKGQRDWRGQRYRLEHLVAHFGKKRIRSITYADIEAFRNRLLSTKVQYPTKKDGTPGASRERSISDVHRVLSLLRTVLTYGYQKEWLTRNPFSKGKGLIEMSQEVPRDRVLSIDEQRALLGACQSKYRRHIYPIILTALDSGCRRGELLKLTWRDVDLEKGTLRVVAMNTKTNKLRVIDLEPVTIAELRKVHKASRKLLDDLVFGIRDNFKGAWHSAMKEAQIGGARFHDLRATAITFWLLRGMRMEFAMRRSGHSDPKIFMRYVRMSESIRETHREQLREWELAEGLAELAGENRSELIN